MNDLKRRITFLIALLITILLTSVTIYANTYQVKYEDYAAKLKEIGVFKGTSSGFELDREPTRIEASIMFVRLLGAEKEAQEKKYEHPFTDVPAWASDYVGYLYHEKLTNGTSPTTFGSNDLMVANSYFTFILRALGYSDADGDFSWDKSIEFAKNNDLIADSDYLELNSSTFLRDHIAKVSYLAFKMQLKDSEISLAEKLVDMGAIDEDKARDIGLSGTVVYGEPTTELTEEDISILQNYDNMFGEPKEGHGFNDVHDVNISQVNAKDSDIHRWIYNTFFDIIYEFDDNEEFYTSPKLTYMSKYADYVIIGALQTILEDGTIEKQNMAYAFNVSAPFGEEPTYYFSGEEKLGDKEIIRKSQSEPTEENDETTTETDDSMTIDAEEYYKKRDKAFDLVIELSAKVTDEMVTELQKYPYYDGEPCYDFEYYNTAIGPANGIIEDFYLIEPAVLKPNQTLLANWHTVYVSNSSNPPYRYYVVRGVLQEKLEDGTVNESYVEFVYKSGKYIPEIGDTTYVLVDKRILK